MDSGKGIPLLVVNFLATLGTEVGVVIDVFGYWREALRINRDAVDTAIRNYPETARNYKYREDLLPWSKWLFCQFATISSLALLSWLAALCWFMLILTGILA